LDRFANADLDDAEWLLLLIEHSDDRAQLHRCCLLMLGLSHLSIPLQRSLLISLLRNPLWIHDQFLHRITSQLVAEFLNPSVFNTVDEDGESVLSVLFYLMLPDGKINPCQTVLDFWSILVSKSSVDLVDGLRAQAMGLVSPLVWSRLFRDHYHRSRPQFVAGQEEFENASLIEQVMELDLKTMFENMIDNSGYRDER